MKCFEKERKDYERTLEFGLLYLGFDDPKFEADLAKFGEIVKKFGVFAGTLQETDPAWALRRGVEMLEEINGLVMKLYEYASLRQSADTKDAAAGSNQGRIMAVYNRCAGPEATFKQYAAKLPNLEELVAGDEVLKEYAFMFREMKENDRYLLSSLGEEITARMGMSGSSAWSDLQSYLTSSVQVEYDGGVTNLSAIRNLAYSPDGNARKAAYEAELKCYDKIKDSVAFALNSIKLETINLAQLRGYDSPLDKTLKNSRMSRKTLDAMFSAIDDYLPKFWEYLRAKAEAMGHKDGMPWYDMFAPMGGSDKTYTTEDAKAYLLNIFGKFDKELHDMVEAAFDNAWIDFFPRDGKVGGAFCAGVECLNESRILTNFDGSFSDIVTLAHELGHAFHNLTLQDQRPLNKDYSMPVAETASTFNECVVMDTAIAAATDKNEKLALIESQRMDATQIICDIYSRYRFETEVFARREQEFMPADVLCQIMLDAQKECYGTGLDQSCLHPYMWVCKSHYYGGTSFYNFPYAFGGLLARGLYAQYEEEGAAFVPKYKAFLRATPVASAEDAAKVAGIDLTEKAFWEKGLSMLAREIDEFVALVKE